MTWSIFRTALTSAI